MNAGMWERVQFEAGLAASLLALQKQHSRVYNDRDDSLIESYLDMALRAVERRANLNLIAATYQSVGDLACALAPCCWLPSYGGTRGYLLPFNNVRELALFDAASTDVTGDWEFTQQEFGSNRDAFALSRTAGASPFPAGTMMQLEVGVADSAELDPAVLAVVLRMAAALYEHRESSEPLTDTVFVASRFEGEIASIWRPTA